MMRNLIALVGLCFFAVGAPAVDPVFTSTPWAPNFVGVERCDLKSEAPRLNRGHAVRIDLKAEGIRLLATPGNGDAAGETDGLKTSTFLTKYKLQVAVNAAPYGPIHAVEDKPQNVAGIQVSGGRLISETEGSYPAILFTRDNKATIAAPPFNLAGIENAVGGFHIVLKKGEVLEGNKDVHPRTAAGVSADGRTLILLVVDGRQKDYSLGLTTGEVGTWLKELGCSEAINLDGGGTTTLVTDDKGKATIVNRPIHAGKPGNERVSASHLGVFAKPLPAK